MGVRRQNEVAISNGRQGVAMARRYCYPPLRIDVERRRPLKHCIPFVGLGKRTVSTRFPTFFHQSPL